jgi:DNA-binding LacI/PurR family transcriptional regulator
MSAHYRMSDTADKAGAPATRKLRVTLRDVAKKLGVSHVTVSLALRNHPSIPATRREEVRLMAEKMGYRPDPLLSSLAVYRTQNRPSSIKSALCWLNHWEQPERLRSYGEFDAYWRGALAAAERFGYHLDDLRWTPDFTAERFEQILLTRGVRGILIPPHQSSPDWGKFDWNKFSVIRFGLSVSYPDSHLVTSDQQRAAIMALRKISNYGYQRIGMVVGDHLDLNIGGNYTGGFHAARELLKLSGIHSMIVIPERDSPAKAGRAKAGLARWLVKAKPDAILTTDPRVPGFLQELGYRIPEDIAVAGTSISDIPVAAGINQNGEEVGRTAVEMLVAQININQRGEPPAPCRILVESFWQDGKSLPARKK